ncbi:site-2 protease family protein [Rhodovastum atsumiense]|uniref:Zinc metalloprotease n=1 Tax=Rhodovastum atsumiense TaxID=504468 RepID=A0A5M6IUJ3_9PROT|nr:site-2 protease family protein [Rhodovastum atsumiense]KAA5611932.1 site-2 protease family protein [Rhodovastum atsumiense]
MTWSFPIVTLKGTVIRLHVTFLLFLAWIAAAHYAQGGMSALVQGVAFTLLLFLSVVLHEFGHVLAARRYGVQTPDITLLPIGGVARLERIPERPVEELVVALAGPAVNLVIAVVLFLVLGGTLPEQSLQMHAQDAGLLARLAVANLFLVLFNLVPAFPMDGGRVLRALLAWRLGYGRATQIAASIGQGLAFALGVLGLFGNPILLFIGLFVWLGAASEAHAVQIREASRGIIAADAAVTQFESLSPMSRVEDAVQCLIRTTQHEFPVVDGGGRLRGVLTRDAMIRALREGGPDTPVIEVMVRDIPMVNHRTSLADALRLLQERQLPAVGVEDGGGRLVGLITPENVGEMMMVQAARNAGPGGGPGGTPPGLRNPWRAPDAGPTSPA